MIRTSDQVVEQTEQSLYCHQLMIYQQNAPLPTTTIQTESGLTGVNFVHNCFVAGASCPPWAYEPPNT